MWIETTDVDEATGALRRQYQAAIGRAGRVYGIVKCMGSNPAVLKSSMQLYRDVMYRESPLSRARRELLATAVSVFNGCHY